LLLILKALVFGTLSYVVRRLGISLILFAYLYALHSRQFRAFATDSSHLFPEASLAAIVIILGVLIILFRSIFNHYSQGQDLKALPKIDQLTLLHLNRGDLGVMHLRAKSRALLECAKGTLLMLILIALCAIAARPLAFILAALLILTLAISLLVGRKPLVSPAASFISKLRSQPDHYVEILLMAGLIVGFLLITQKGGLISGTVLILMIARFSGALRTIATNLINLVRWHYKDLDYWRNRAAQEAHKSQSSQIVNKPTLAAGKTPT
jgi:hypothetical protein